LKPQVIIIGRPNVGKSTLFNRLVGKKLALVDDQPGVTRDRRFGDAELAGMQFTIVDTAGWEDEDAASLPGRMRRQTEASLEGADAALFVIDARAGITPLDEEIAQSLREYPKELPIILVANKAEGRAAEPGIFEAYSLGLGDPVPISAEHGQGTADLFQALWPVIGEKSEQMDDIGLSDEDDEEPASGPLKLAIVGRPNAGKSTLINRLLGEDRLLTGPEAGITRDSIAVDWDWTDPRSGERRDIRLIDTAGMRKKANVVDKLEQMAVTDARRAIDFAEVVVLLLDATRGLEHQDLKIASLVIEEGRALMVAINKWDVAENASSLFNGIKTALEEGLSQVSLPVLAVSAKTGKGLDTMLGAAFELREAWSRRVPTAALNRWFEDALEANPPPAPGGKRIKLRYITQTSTRPPRFVVFGTRLELLPVSYERYLVNSIRRDLNLGAVPVRLTLRSPKNPFADRK
jgi:GTP-binding protein